MYLFALHVLKLCVANIVLLKSSHILNSLVRLAKVNFFYENIRLLNQKNFLLGTDLKFNGPFHCLNHKVDLTHDEAENTLFQRQNQLEQ